MKEQTRAREGILTSPQWNLLLSIAVFCSFGFQLLCYFRDSWFPFWVKISVSIFFGLLCVACAIHFTSDFSRNGLPLLREVAFVFKPYILWASIALMTLSWVIALISYELLWFLVAFGTTLLVFVIGFFSLRTLVQQIESTETDIV